jgi:gliding motility-associated-like protein
MNSVHSVFLTSLLVFTSLTCTAQKEANVWYFSNRLGLDFNYSPPRILTDGQITTSPNGIGCESASSISDKNGNLLFYTDGMTVWNRMHTVMENGTELGGAHTTTQTLIIPQPGSENLFFIFTASPQGDFVYEVGGNIKGFYFSLVDLSLNKGMGGILIKNQLLSLSTTEKIAGTKHANGSDIWVVMHEWNNNRFRSYLITNQGIQRPVISEVGSVHTGGVVDDRNAIGQMKFSPSGERLALVIRDEMIVELFHFDLSTGKLAFWDKLEHVTSPENIPLYGIEFSPSGRFLYVTDGARSVFQYDLYAKSVSDSKVTMINHIPPLNDQPAGLQLAPDGKIYVSKFSYRFMGIIHFPDSAGIGCYYDLRGVQFDENGSGFSEGIPNFLSSYFHQRDRYPQNPYFEMPNVFTPNGDGINDRFIPKMNYNTAFVHLVIYNRWGGIVCETTDMESGWDGENFATGIYYWIAYYKGLNGKEGKQKGYVTLLR